MRFAERVVLVTGGAAGIGRGCAEVFHREGARLALLDRDDRALAAVVSQFEQGRPGSTWSHVCDVADSEQLTALTSAAAKCWGRLDCLINNAGIHPPSQSIEQTSDDELWKVLQTNFVSAFVASRAALPFLRTTQGTIINISSMTAILGQNRAAAYAASKGAMLSFTKALALETAPDGIRVNAVLPSNVDTPLMRSWAATLPDPQQALDRIAQLQPLGRMADPQEIGRVCLFLATDDASFITGQGLQVDGGAALDY
jgi:NAD(P)-dependent dehydrogenase (short-subunit alcohol dehydrogenase family)